MLPVPLSMVGASDSIDKYSDGEIDGCALGAAEGASEGSVVTGRRIGPASGFVSVPIEPELEPEISSTPSSVSAPFDRPEVGKSDDAGSPTVDSVAELELCLFPSRWTKTTIAPTSRRRLTVRNLSFVEIPILTGRDNMLSVEFFLLVLSVYLCQRMSYCHKFGWSIPAPIRQSNLKPKTQQLSAPNLAMTCRKHKYMQPRLFKSMES